MVRCLVVNKADVNQRVTGNLFYPEDQANIQYNHDSEYPVLPLQTNYESNSYYGEYPLSFAAVLNQEESIRYLIIFGAKLDNQDSNGNTALHLVVIKNNLV